MIIKNGLVWEESGSFRISSVFKKSWLRCITDLRNRCAHYSRLYDWSFTALPKMPKESVAPQNRKLFSQILVLKRLYPDKKEWNTALRLSVWLSDNYISTFHIDYSFLFALRTE